MDVSNSNKPPHTSLCSLHSYKKLFSPNLGCNWHKKRSTIFSFLIYFFFFKFTVRFVGLTNLMVNFEYIYIGNEKIGFNDMESNTWPWSIVCTCPVKNIFFWRKKKYPMTLPPKTTASHPPSANLYLQNGAAPGPWACGPWALGFKPI